MDSDSLKQKQNVSIFISKKLHNDPSLKLESSEISVVDEYKNLKKHLPNDTSIFGVEAYAINITWLLTSYHNDYDVQICWVPGHTGISENDQADKAAKSTLNIITEKKV